MSLKYPDSLPLDSIKEIVRIIQAGNTVPEKAALAKHLWVVQGYAQKMLVGDPDSVLVGMQNPTLVPQAMPDNLPDLVSMLEKLALAESGAEFTAQEFQVPPAWLLQLVIEKLVELLLAYLKNKN